jgi:hypothetical protein
MAEAVIVMSVAAWAEQGHQAYRALMAKRPPGSPTTIASLDAVDHDLFATMIEALVALSQVTGVKVAPELIRLAGLRPVAEVLGLR